MEPTNLLPETMPFAGAVLLFVLSFIGIAISLYPMIVPYHFTLWEAASSERTQAFLLVGTLALANAPAMNSELRSWRAPSSSAGGTIR